MREYSVVALGLLIIGMLCILYGVYVYYQSVANNCNGAVVRGAFGYVCVAGGN